MARWIRLASSKSGERHRNEDVVATHTIPRRGGGIDVIAVCDGVGSRPEALECAQSVAQAAVRRTTKYLAARGHGALKPEDARILRDLLSRIRVRGISKESATTLTLVLFERKPHRAGYGGLAIWAGDTRASLLEASGKLQSLTRDHHDEEGRLTCYVMGTGRVFGSLEHSFFSSGSPCVLYVTTDGVHERCSLDELRSLGLYCMDHGVRSDKVFSKILTQFLAENISDNFSAVIVYRLLSRDDLADVIANSGVEHANTCSR